MWNRYVWVLEPGRGWRCEERKQAEARGTHGGVEGEIYKLDLIVLVQDLRKMGTFRPFLFHKNGE